MTSSQWQTFASEPALDPDLPIIDTHHHIWGQDWDNPIFKPYDLDELIADKALSAHNVVATVLVDGHSHYYTDGPQSMRPVGETVNAQRIAEESAQRGGKAGGLCSAIVPFANLTLGAAVGGVLDAHADASPRLRGIRHMLAFDASLPPIYGASEAGITQQPAFRQGFAELARRGLSFEAWAFQTQLGEVQDLAAAFPDTSIILNHLGGPLAIGPFAGRRKEGFQAWRTAMMHLARCSNITVKLGGLYVSQTEPAAYGFPSEPLSSEQFADINRDYVLTAIELFGPERCMFESNFPVEMLSTTYDTLWNGFKRIVADFSASERQAMFAGVARRIYRIAD